VLGLLHVESAALVALVAFFVAGWWAWGHFRRGVVWRTCCTGSSFCS